MRKEIKILSILLLLSIILVTFCGCNTKPHNKVTYTQVENDGYYLLCYFVGSIDGADEEQSVHFALSSNGYDYSPLNNNKAVIEHNLGTQCVRDPYIFQAGDKYYVIGTDMDSKQGWLSNHAMVMWESDDLVNWYNERIIDMYDYEGYETSNRTWAPQVIYDEKEGKYMCYWTNSLFYDKDGDGEDDDDTYIVYAYFNDDFTELGEINKLFEPKNGKSVIDADIVKEGDTYYMYYKYNSSIKYVTSTSLTGPWDEPMFGVVSSCKTGVEGSLMYKLVGTDTWIMIADNYGSGTYYMATTTSSSMTTFEDVAVSCYTLDFYVKHASVLTITEEQYNMLLNYEWPSI